MKKLILIALLGSGFVVGCRTRYEITLNNSNTITAMSKPKLEDGAYVFKDANGRTSSVPSSRVRLIQPQSYSSKPPGGPFKPSQ